MIEDFPNLIAANNQDGGVEELGVSERMNFTCCLLMRASLIAVDHQDGGVEELGAFE